MASAMSAFTASAMVTVFVATTAVAAAAEYAAPARRPLFREYLGAEFKNVTFADVPVHPGVDFHFILSFAIDYTVDASGGTPRPADGRFTVYWDEAHLSPADVAAVKRAHGNVRVALSLAGDSISSPGAGAGSGSANVTFLASSVDAWVRNAVESLTAILRRYGLDGVDVDYEHFGETPEVFAECVGRLVRRLRADGVISFASIAPFANPDVQAHYLELWRRYGREFEYVNFQFYAYPANTTVAQFLGHYNEQSWRYGGGTAAAGGRVLVGFGTDPSSNGLRPGKGFFTACEALRRQGRLHGVFVWAADNSLADGFRYERAAQWFLAGDAPGFGFP